MSVVVDASIVVSWFFDDERSEAVDDALQLVIAEGAVAPQLWRLEVANALRNAVRRGRCSADYAEQCLERLTRLRIATDGDTERNAWGTTWMLSRRHNLTVYDAAYLELAVRLSAVLASRDGALSAAARSIGLGTIGD